MHIGIPQFIIILLSIFNIGSALIDVGQSRESNIKFLAVVIGTAINIGLLKWGGFFG